MMHKSKLLEDLENYDPHPSEALQRKIDFFITPYNSRVQMGKYMTFDKPEPVNMEARRSQSLDISEPFDAVGES